MFSGKIVAFLTTDYIAYNHSAVTNEQHLDRSCLTRWYTRHGLHAIHGYYNCYNLFLACLGVHSQAPPDWQGLTEYVRSKSWNVMETSEIWKGLKACNFCNVCDGFVRNSISHHPPVVQHRGLLKMLALVPNNGTILDWNSSFDPDFTLKVGMSKKTETTFEVFLKKDIMKPAIRHRLSSGDANKQ